MGKVRGAFKILGNVLFYALLALALLVLILSIATKKGEDGAATVFGKQLRIVQSDSMAKCELTDVSAYAIKDLPVKTLLVIETVPTGNADEWYRQIQKGDVLTFRYKYKEQVTITHRVTKITEKETGGFVIELTGDNKSSEDNLSQTIDTSQVDSFDYVIGKVVWANPALGWLVYALRSPVAIVCLIIIPCVIVIVVEIVRIINALGASKNEKAKNQEEEIERLKRRLAELEDKEE